MVVLGSRSSGGLLRLRNRLPERMVGDLRQALRTCESLSQRRENDPARRFANVKAQNYQALADAFERDEIHGLSDDITIGQLAGILYEIDSHGRIKIESKEEARGRGVSSPDRAEALMLALGELPPEPYAYTPVPRPDSLFQSTPGCRLSVQEQDTLDDMRQACGFGRMRKSRRWGPGGY
jgi:hypothetical protein